MTPSEDAAAIATEAEELAKAVERGEVRHAEAAEKLAALSARSDALPHRDHDEAEWQLDELRAAMARLQFSESDPDGLTDRATRIADDTAEHSGGDPDDDLARVESAMADLGQLAESTDNPTVRSAIDREHDLLGRQADWIRDT